MHTFVLAITGASGALYSLRLLEVLQASGRTVFLSISPSGQAVLDTELGVKVDLEKFSPADLLAKARDKSVLAKHSDKIHYCHFQDLMSPIASGSFLTGGMVVCPCSGSTLAAISHSMGSKFDSPGGRSPLKGATQIGVSATRNAAIAAANR